MKPSDELIDKFRQIYFREFKEELTRQEAHEKFLRLANLVRVILRPGSGMKLQNDQLGSSVPKFDQNAGNDKMR